MRRDVAMRKLIRQALREDIGKGDMTTSLCIPKEKRCRGKIIVRERGIVAGLWCLRPLFRSLDRSVKVRTRVKEGRGVQKDKLVATLEGPARSILTGERVALNFLSRLSGIATLTRRYLQRVRPYPAKILATRKTTPGWRSLEKYAIRIGGGEIHRMGLYDEVLIKENHLTLRSKNERQKSEPLEMWIRGIRKKLPNRIKMAVEAQSLREVRALLNAPVDRILLDNLTPKEIRKAVSLRNQRGKRPLLQASGGISLDNVRAIARSGVEEISIGRLTHSAPALNMSMDIDRIR